MTATVPHGHGVVVGGVDALALGVDATELYAVVLQQVLAVLATRPLVHLRLRERRHLGEVTVGLARCNTSSVRDHP